MPRMEVLVGMIASGKSTYSKTAARDGAIVINDDAIVTAVHGSVYTLYSKRLKLLYKSVENHIAATALALGLDVIVDRGLNISVDARRRWVALAKSFDVSCHAVVFDREQPAVHARRRFDSDARGLAYADWLEIAKAHAARYQFPRPAEGFSSVVRVTPEQLFGKEATNGNGCSNPCDNQIPKVPAAGREISTPGDARSA